MEQKSDIDAVVSALCRVRNTLGLVENGLIVEEAVRGRRMLEETNSVRQELVLLNWAIARLSGRTAVPPPL